MHRWHWARVLLLIPFVAVLSVPYFDRVQPVLFSFPFFYWYQLMWVLLSVLVIGLVYRLEHGGRE